MSNEQYDDAILNSNAIDPTDKDGNPIPVTIPIMLAPGITVVYTTRLGGASEGDFAHFNLGGKTGDNPEHVLANRMALAATLGAKISLVSQVHSGNAVDVDEAFVLNRPFGFDVSGTKADTARTVDDTAGEPAVIEADGQVTSQKNVALGMFAADCLPVLMADPEAGVIGAAHCGRRGLQQGVIGATIGAMAAKGAKPERIVATLGPCICGDCYEVGGDIADEFDAQFPGMFTLSRFGQPGIDIAAAALQELAKAGVPADKHRLLPPARQCGHPISERRRGTRHALPERRRRRTATVGTLQEHPPQPVHARESAMVLASPCRARRQTARRAHAGADRTRIVVTAVADCVQKMNGGRCGNAP